MKNCKLKKYDTPNNASIFTKDKYFSVFLDRELTIRFSNKKHCEKFLSDLRKDIDNLITTVNNALCDIYKYYRISWYYTRINYFDEFENIESYLNKIVKYEWIANANYFIFTSLVKLFDELDYLCDLILKVFKKQNLWIEIKFLENIKKRLIIEITNFKTDINNKNKAL
jgi:hypothetical protein